ncbi:MAG TPA: bacillithiol biosynthesis BshC, partial [Chitinophagales bacterium]|nr:bacillithiol biosynthesis BshC [Chitinophagales bacterium]
AFVGGAGELSYWLELKPLFDHYKVNYPMQVMRGSAAIVTPPVQKKLEKLDLSVKDFFVDVEQLINSYIKRNMDAGANLSAERLAAEELFVTVLAKAEAVDVTLKQSATGERQKLITALENLEAKMVKAEKRKQETTVTQIRSIHDSLFPNGTLQERHDNFIGYVESDFISAIVQYMDAFDKQFKVLVKE